MKPISFFRLPLFWLFLGPPAFRNLGTRGPTDSMTGDNDIWNYVRLAWWCFFGVVSVIELIRMRAHFPEFFRRMGTLTAFVGLFVMMLFVSSAASPTPLYTIVMAVMMTILVLAATDFALKTYLGLVAPTRTLKLILLLSLALMCLVYFIFLTNPASNVAMEVHFGKRVRGGTVAYTPLLSLVCIFLGAYFLITSKNVWVRALAVFAILFGLHMLKLGQTRSSYLGLFLGAGVFIAYRFNVLRNVVLVSTAVSAFFAFVCLLFVAYDLSHGVRWRMDDYFEQYVLRDKYAVEDPEFAKSNIGSLNGRSEVFFLLAGHAFSEPVGLGFIAGPRLFLSQRVVGLPSAHNAYTEILAGCGPAGFFAWMMIVGTAVVWNRRLRFREALALRALLPPLLLEGMFESDMVFPFVQSSVLFWILAATIVGLYCRQEAAAAPTPWALVDLRRTAPAGAAV